MRVVPLASGASTAGVSAGVSAGASAGAVSVATVGGSATVSVASATSLGASVAFGASGACSLLGPPVIFWKLPEIRRLHLPGRLLSSPETAPASSSDVTASAALAWAAANHQIRYYMGEIPFPSLKYARFSLYFSPSWTADRVSFDCSTRVSITVFHFWAFSAEVQVNS